MKKSILIRHPERREGSPDVAHCNIRRSLTAFGMRCYRVSSYLLCFLLSCGLSIADTISSEERLTKAIENPEYMIKNWVDLPISPGSTTQKKRHLSLREAILLALRYNPNIQNAELDRIVQRYQLRLAHNAFELQYALAGTAWAERTSYAGAGNVNTNRFLATPEMSLNTKYGTKAALTLDNNIAPVGNYNQLLNVSLTQPLLRGFGKSVNEAGLLNAIDNEQLNKINLQQAVIDQITQVIISYRALVLSANNLKTQESQLKEAHLSFSINEKKIAAGQLEPTANVQQSYQIESLSLMVEQARNDFKTATQDLLQAIGLDPEMRLAVPSDVSLGKIHVPNVAKATELALTHNAQFLALKTLIRADERAYAVAKNQQLWQLDATANVQGGASTDVQNQSGGFGNIYNGNNITESAGVRLTIPLHDLNRRDQLISAKIRLEKDRLNLMAAKRALMTLIKNTISTIESQAKRYELAKRQVELAAKSYALEKKKQQAGISSGLDVSNTQNQLIQAQIGLIGAKIAYLNQVATLQRVLGTTLDEWKITLRYGG